MSYQQEVFALVGRMSGTRNKVIVERSLCEYMGSLEGGVFLSQLLYWCDKGSTEWVYKSYKEWHAETYLSEYQIRQVTKKCIELGFLETKVKKANGVPTVHYKVDGEKFLDSILKFLSFHSEKFNNGNSNIEESITEITTETTTEKRNSISFESPWPENPTMEKQRVEPPYTDFQEAVKPAKEPKPLTSQQEMFGAICEAIGADPATLTKEDQGQIAQAMGILVKASYNIDDVRAFMVDIWFKDWRWVKHGQHPTLAQLRKEIGKIRSVVAAAAPKPQSNVDNFFELARKQGARL